MNLTLVRALLPFVVAMIWLISLYLFLRGHNEPGGGFIAALCFGLGILAYSYCGERPGELFRKSLPLAEALIALGFMCFIISLLLPLAFMKAPLEGLWTSIPLPIAGKLSTILVFDLGVFLIVSAAVIFIFERMFSGADS